MKYIAVVGCGYWGKNLLRNFYQTPGCSVQYACDTNKKNLKIIQKLYPKLCATSDFDIVLQDKKIDACVIATPTATHYKLAKKAIMAGKDILVEKPFTDNLSEARKLIDLAETKKVIIMVDNTFLFSEAVKKIKKMIDTGSMGEIFYIDSIRLNPGMVRADTNVIFDLASHDFSIANYLLGVKPKSIKSFGTNYLNQQIDDCHIVASYAKRVSVHIHVGWLSPVKVRTFTIVGSKRRIVYDEMEPFEKVKVYKNDKTWAPRVSTEENLKVMAKKFISSLNFRKVEMSSGLENLAIVESLEKANLALKS